MRVEKLFEVWRASLDEEDKSYLKDLEQSSWVDIAPEEERPSGAPAKPDWVEDVSQKVGMSRVNSFFQYLDRIPDGRQIFKEMRREYIKPLENAIMLSRERQMNVDVNELTKKITSFLRFAIDRFLDATIPGEQLDTPERLTKKLHSAFEVAVEKYPEFRSIPIRKFL